jgi:hypothetical protein
LQKEEIEWLGLSLKDAVKKQHELELAAAQAAVRPLKEIYTMDLIARIKGTVALRLLEEIKSPEAEAMFPEQKSL